MLAAGVLYLLQLFPVTGVILMMLQAGLFTGSLLLLAVVSFFAEALFGFVPRILLTVPLALVAGYYTSWLSDLSKLSELATALNIRAPTAILAYNPQDHVLAYNSLDLLAGYNLPSTYIVHSETSRMIGKTKTCEMIRYGGSNPNSPGAPIGIRADSLGKSFCFSDSKGALPASRLVGFEKNYSGKDIDGVRVQIQTLIVTLGGKQMGGHDIATVQVLKPFPVLFVGCGLNDHPAAWVCVADFMRDTVRLAPSGQPQPAGTEQWSVERMVSGKDDAEQAAYLAALLALTPRSAAEIDALARAN